MVKGEKWWHKGKNMWWVGRMRRLNWTDLQQWHCKREWESSN
jgi:hypothetical protein